MKFGKRLQRLLEDSIPEWRDKFISYKLLKQNLKLIVGENDVSPSLCFSQSVCRGKAEETLPDSQFRQRVACSTEEFIALLFSEVEKMNTFFLEMEEEFIIRCQGTKRKLDKLHKLNGGNCLDLSQEMVELRKAVVNIHGEMVLLENYSALNYRGLVKIVKKYDKKTGGLLRVPFIQIVLHQPFYATDIISKLIQECEETLQVLFPQSRFNGCRTVNSVRSCNGNLMCFEQCDLLPAYNEISDTFVGDHKVERICRNTMAAWQIMREFRKGSSTYNFFSIPPFGCTDFDGMCCKPAMTEQLVWQPEVPVGPEI